MTIPVGIRDSVNMASHIGLDLTNWSLSNLTRRVPIGIWLYIWMNISARKRKNDVQII